MKMKSKCENKVIIRKSEKGLVINKRWLNLKMVISAILVSIYFFISVKLLFDFSIIDDNPAILISVYTVSALFLSYMLVAGWLNSKRVIVAEDVLKIVQWPVPFIGNTSIPASEIVYLYIRNNIVKKSRKKVNYEIRALTLGGRDMKIFEDLNSLYQAGKIKKNIANFLNIADIPASSGSIINLCR